MAEFWRNFFDLSATWSLLRLGFVQTALIAGALLALVAGVLGPMIVSRNMAFSVHATSESAFTGAAAALLLGVNIGYGALGAAVIIALVLAFLSQRAGERDSVIGAVLSFALGLGMLLLWFYPGRASNKFGLLVGQIVSVDSTQLTMFVVAVLAVLAVLAVIYRPLLFLSMDADVAIARGVPARLLSPLFAVLVGVATALGVQVVGALLVMSLMITPGAAATRITSSPLASTIASVIFAELAMVGGTVLSLAPGAPVSAFVTAISFVIYLACRAVGALRTRRIRPLASSKTHQIDGALT